MQVYLNAVMVLNFLVDFLLLMGTNRLCGYPPEVKCALPAALLGGLYSGVCLLPGFRFLSGIPWRLVCLLLMALLAFGISMNALRRCGIFVLLNMALSGIMLGLGEGKLPSLLFAAAAVLGLCHLGFHSPIGANLYVPVELSYADKHVRLTALKDTGNTLRDPITGKPVLVLGADAAQQLTGLSQSQLRQPVETMGAIPGLRLIPYKTVGDSNGFLLAMRLPRVRIGAWEGSGVVAFAPERLHSEGAYQALTGGVS